ncbi:hypothetical protein EMIT0P176_110006 [Pseudomonas sp. IT-P176]
MDADVLGKRTPMSEARLELLVAHLLIAAVALCASTTPAYERHGHTVADLPSRDVFSHLGHDARELMTWYMRQFNVGVMTFPAMPVAAAYTCAKNLDNHTMPFRRRICHVHQARRLGKRFVDDCFHSNSLCLDGRCDRCGLNGLPVLSHSAWCCFSPSMRFEASLSRHLHYE